MADEDLIEDTAFKAIINASLIARYGADIFVITNYRYSLKYEINRSVGV